MLVTKLFRSHWLALYVIMEVNGKRNCLVTNILHKDRSCAIGLLWLINAEVLCFDSSGSRKLKLTVYIPWVISKRLIWCSFIYLFFRLLKPFQRRSGSVPICAGPEWPGTTRPAHSILSTKHSWDSDGHRGTILHASGFCFFWLPPLGLSPPPLFPFPLVLFHSSERVRIFSP